MSCANQRPCFYFYLFIFFKGFSEFSSGEVNKVSPEVVGVLSRGGGGGDSLAGSLEDLVTTFDEKLTMCFQDYQEQVDKIAPVQVKYVDLQTPEPL